MKRNHLLVALLYFCGWQGVNAQQHTVKQHFVIKGQLGSVREPAKVYIIYSDRGMRSDSAVITNGRFTLEGEVSMQQRVNIFMRQNGEPARSGNARDQAVVYLDQS